MKYQQLFLMSCFIPLASLAEVVELSSQTVTADFRSTDIQQLPEAVTLIDSDRIEGRAAEHLEQVLSFAPNVNFSSGSSRARYYQIRGVGDRSQFIDPVNPAVGLFIDGIDMTGLGAAATLFDINQVEILRGPQGTRYGANSLGGLINITSNDPTEDTDGFLSLRLGNYQSYATSGALSGRINKDIKGRLALHRFSGDGYTENTYLDRKDTQNFDESLLRAKLAWELAPDSELKFTFLYADIKNGYDSFTLDNSRNSLADEPGQDSQETMAWSLTYNNTLNSKVHFESIISGSHNDSTYSFDEDWVHPDLHPDTYSYFDQYKRTYKRGSIDFRFLSGHDGRLFDDTTDWVIGFYAMTREDRLDRDRRKEADWIEYHNNLDVSSVSLYGELTTDITVNSRLIYGARIENWKNKFLSSDAVEAETNDWLVGGKITYEEQILANHLSYLSYARGYKPAGVNSNADIDQRNRKFSTEYNDTYELGLKSSWFEKNLKTRAAIFAIQRKDQQVKSSYAYKPDSNPATPVQFQDYLANAAKGRNYGFELESQWQLRDDLSWDLSYGFLKTKFSDYSYYTDGGLVNKTGRAQAHAPEHTLNNALTYEFMPSWALRLEAEYKDGFYFSDSHDERAPSATLLHTRLSYQFLQLNLAFSVRNLTNKKTETRGFGGFGNDPRDGWAESKYVQLGEPRLVMIEGKVTF